MNKLSVLKQGTWRWAVATIAILVVIGAASFTLLNNGEAAHATGNRTVTVWLQATDSCMEALSGATFTVDTAAWVPIATTAPTNGSLPKSLPTYTHGQCPVQQGTCANFPTGCTTAVLNVPASGTVLYKILVATTAPGQGSNLRYAICEGGSDCPHGPEVAYVVVSSNGTTATWVRNFEPDGTFDRWPSNRSAFAGTQSDPILFHEFGIGNGSLTCDGDHDADDYLTGYRWPHCDSDNG